jgi:hypothetical protein
VDLFPVASAEQGADLRGLLSGRGFTTEEVCHRVGIGSIYDFRSIREGRTAGLALSDALDLMIRLFMDVELVERGAIDSLLSPEECRLLEDLRLIRVGAGGRWQASVLLYPTDGSKGGPRVFPTLRAPEAGSSRIAF